MGKRKLLVLFVCLANDKSCVHVYLSHPYVTRMYSRLSLNGHLCKKDASLKRTPRVGPRLSLLPLFDSL